MIRLHTAETTIRHRAVASIGPGTFDPPRPAYGHDDTLFDPRLIRATYERTNPLEPWTVTDAQISGPILRKDGSIGVRDIRLMLDGEGRPVGSGSIATDHLTPDDIADLATRGIEIDKPDSVTNRALARNMPIEWAQSWIADNQPPESLASSPDTSAAMRYLYPHIYAHGYAMRSTSEPFVLSQALLAADAGMPVTVYRQETQSDAERLLGDELREMLRTNCVTLADDAAGRPTVWWLANGLRDVESRDALCRAARNIRAGRPPWHVDSVAADEA